MALLNLNGDNYIFSKIKSFVSEKVFAEFSLDLFQNSEAKKEVEKGVVKKLSEFISQNPRVFIPPEFVFRVSDKALIDIVSWRNTGVGLVPHVRFPEIAYDSIEPGHLSENHQPLGFHEYLFFTHLEMRRDSRFKRQTSSGYWELHKIMDITSENGVSGKRTEQSFYEGTRPGTKTLWKMYEYKLSVHEYTSGWVLCKAYNLDIVDNNWVAGPQQRRKSPDKRRKTKSPEKSQEPQTLDLLSEVM